LKILYAIQATGNGHISRAKEILPFLKRFGTVDIFLSGSNSHLNPGFEVTYQSKGLSLFYGKSGNLDYLKMMKDFNPSRIWREANDLPVEKYDLVINDFECISALSCHKKNIPFVHFGHQASFQSPLTPLPNKYAPIGKWVLKNYVKTPFNIGLHFDSYDQFIYSPIIKKDILHAQPTNRGHVTVYLSHYDDLILEDAFSMLPDIPFHIFSKKVKSETRKNNIIYFPISTAAFNESLIHCAGIITGAGFETPAEALYLKKKLLCIPIKGQFEQWCNAEALKNMNVNIIDHIGPLFSLQVARWMNHKTERSLVLKHTTDDIIEKVIELGMNISVQELPSDFSYINPIPRFES
jgi:uncharacterized protein (TIGR00661 family)